MATTINTYSVSLTLDAAEYINKAALSGQETRRLSRAIEEARDPADKYTVQLVRLNKAFEKGAIDQGTYNRLLQSAKSKYDQAASSAAKLNATQAQNANGLDALGGSLRRLAAGYLTVQTLTKAIRLSIDAEQAAARFDVLTGSVQNSKALLGDIRKFSDETPLSFQGVQNAAQTMLAFNVPLQDVMRNLQMLGDVSGGNEERFKLMTLAFSQMTAAGRLQGQDLLQMINAGFNPLQEIAAKTGETMMELRARMEAGAISAQEVTAAFAAATGEGGRFNGMMDGLSGTVGGKLAIAMADLEKAGIALGDALGPIIIQLTDGFNESKGALGGLVWLMQKFGDGISFAIAASRDFAALPQSIYNMEDPLKNVNKQLDLMDQRDREASATPAGSTVDADAAKKAAEANAAANTSSAQLETSYQKQVDALKMRNIELEHGEQAAQRHKLLAEGMNIYQIFEIEKLQEANKQLEKATKLEEERAAAAVKAEEDRKKAIEKMAEESRKAFEKNVTDAIDAARRYYEEERKKAEDIQKQISQGIGGDFEVGSSEAQKFFADQANARIGAAAMPDMAKPTDQMIAEQAKLQLAEAAKQTAIQTRQEQLLKQMISTISETAVRPIR